METLVHYYGFSSKVPQAIKYNFVLFGFIPFSSKKVHSHSTRYMYRHILNESPNHTHHSQETTPISLQRSHQTTPTTDSKPHLPRTIPQTCLCEDFAGDLQVFPNLQVASKSGCLSLSSLPYEGGYLQRLAG